METVDRTRVRVKVGVSGLELGLAHLLLAAKRHVMYRGMRYIECPLVKCWSWTLSIYK